MLLVKSEENTNMEVTDRQYDTDEVSPNFNPNVPLTLLNKLYTFLTIPSCLRWYSIC